MAPPPSRKPVRRWMFLALFLYAVLLAMSHYVLHDRGSAASAAPADDKKTVTIDGKRLAYLEWGGAQGDLAPLILLHGSPSRGARDWEKLASKLALGGRRIIAIDRWGYGASETEVDDYSFAADKEAVLGLMDALGLERAHIAGWSYGGGPAILLGEPEGRRILSISLIGAIGIQEGEGSGSHRVEHWKYAALNALVTWLPEALPHFGLLGTRLERRVFARDFMDSDQRALKSALTTMNTPLLIIHGRKDFLVPAWVAQEHHQLQPKSRLVILNASHFFPLGVGRPANLDIAVDEITRFLAAAEGGRASELYGVRNETSRKTMRAVWDGGPELRGYKPWWIVFLAGLALGFFLPRSAAILVGFGGALLLLDPLTALVGIVLGAVIKRGESRTRFHKAAGVCLYCLLGALPGLLLLQFL